jgi:hypothetical protein
MPAAPVTMPTDPVAATRRKLARLLAVGAMRAAAGRAPGEAGERAELAEAGEFVAGKPGP